MKKMMTALVGLTLATSAMAAGSTSTGTLGKIKDNMSMSIDNLLYNTYNAKEDTREFTSNVIYVTNGYKVNKNNSLALETRIITSGLSSEDGAETNLNRIRLHWTRSNLATQARHGVNWSAGITRSQTIDKDSRTAGEINGYTRFKTGVSRTLLGDTMRLSGTFYHYIMERRDADKTGLGTYTNLISLRESVKISDKFTFYLGQDLANNRYKNEDQINSKGNKVYEKTSLDALAGISFSATDKVSLGLEAGNTVFEEHDKKGLLSTDFVTGAYLEFALSVSAF